MSEKKGTFPIPIVAIVILNWNGWRDTIVCLESLYQVAYPNFYVILIDNSSDDDSVRMIRDYCLGIKKVESEFLCDGHIRYPIQIQEYDRVSLEDCIKASPGDIPSPGGLILIKNERNFGFAEGNNIGMRFALQSLQPDYVLLLNNDTQVNRKFLAELVRVAEKDGQIGSVQSLLLRPGGKIIDSLGQKLYLLGARDHESGTVFRPDQLKEDMEIFGPCAAAALYRSDALNATGLLDDDFFIGYEDVDLSFRLRLSGYISMLSSKSIVYHKRGISGGRCLDNSVHLMSMYHGNKNWVLLALRYYSASDILITSRKFFRSLCWWMFYALKLGKAGEFSGLMLRSLKIRSQITTNPCINEVRAKWINRKKL